MRLMTDIDTSIRSSRIVRLVVDLLVRKASGRAVGRPLGARETRSLNQPDHSVFRRRSFPLVVRYEIEGLTLEVEGHFDRRVQRLPVLHITFVLDAVEKRRLLHRGKKPPGLRLDKGPGAVGENFPNHPPPIVRRGSPCA